MADVNMPAGFSGLMRYKDEYDSRFKISPAQVILMIILTVIVMIGLNIFFPIA